MSSSDLERRQTRVKIFWRISIFYIYLLCCATMKMSRKFVMATTHVEQQRVSIATAQSQRAQHLRPQILGPPPAPKRFDLERHNLV